MFFLTQVFDKNGRMAGGIWRRGGETPSAVKREDRIIEIREGSWSYLASTIGRVPGMFLKSYILLFTTEQWNIISMQRLLQIWKQPTVCGA